MACCRHAADAQLGRELGLPDLFVEKVPEIDAILNEKMQGWTTERISKVELTILRLGAYEILFDDSIPAGDFPGPRN